MADFDKKLDLTPRPVYPEPSPSAELPEVASPSSTFEVGSGSEVRKSNRIIGTVNSEQRSRFSDEVGENARDIAERARDKFQVVADDARERMNQLTDRASDIADQAGHRINELRDRLNERLPEWKRQAQVRVEGARIRARNLALQTDARARRKPLETIAIAAGAGFVLGASMRIWRSSRG